MNGMVVLMIAVFVVVLVIAFKANAKERAARLAAWAAFAEARGLRMAGADPHIVGELDGVSVTIDTFTKSSTDSDGTTRTTTYTRVGAWAPSGLQLEVKVYPEHVFSGLGKMLGFQDVTSGDAAFDDAMVVKASNEDGARTLLVAGVRRKLRAFTKGLHFTYDKGNATIEWQGAEKNHAVLASALDAVVAAARAASSDEDDDGDDAPEQKPRRRRRPRRRAAEASDDES
jgi:hypothetical protein